MEQWERKFINKNLPFFIENIQCTTMLRAMLLSQGCLSLEDGQKLECSGVGLETSGMLLSILNTKTNGYIALAQALFKTNQTGAFLNMLLGVEANISAVSSFEYCGIDVDPNLLLEMKLVFGSKEVPLNSFLPVEIDACRFVQPILDASTYKQLLSGKPFVLLPNGIPEELKYYIPRSILLYSKLNIAVFAELSSDVFVIQGLEPFQLTHLALSVKAHKKNSDVQLTDISSNQLYELTVRFILLEHTAHFDRITSKSTKRVHWVKFVDNEYFIVKSAGLHAVQKIRCYLQPVTLSEDKFVRDFLHHQTGKHVILCDSPGMGKTVLLEQIGRRLELENSKNIVMFLNSTEVADISISDKKNPNSSEILCNILSKCTKNPFGNKLLSKLFSTKSVNGLLMLDAFDELSTQQQERFSKILRVILSEYSYLRLIVTSRNHGQEELENIFGSPSYKILSFQESDMLTFFIKYWEKKHCIKPTTEVEKFAFGCIESWENTVSSEERKITGIPLQCQMLADLYAEEASTLVDNLNYVSMSGFISNGLVQLYTKFVNKCFNGIEDKQEYINYHIFKALDLLFPCDHNRLVYNNGYEYCEETVFSIGLIEKSSMGRTQFVHRTFAEFLAAKFFKSILQGNPGYKCFTDTEHFSLLTKWFFQVQGISNTNTVLYNIYHQVRSAKARFVYQSVLYFLNNLLLQPGNDVFVVENVWEYFAQFEEFSSCLLSVWIAVSIASQFNQLIKFICCLILKSSTSCETTIKMGLRRFCENTLSVPELAFKQDLVKLSAGYSSACIFKCFWEVLNHSLETKTVEVAHEAVDLGNYGVFEYLYSLDKQNILAEKYILLSCLTVRMDHSQRNVNGKLQILKFLLKENPSFINENAHLSDHSSFALIKHLILCGANLDAKTVHGNNITHTALYFCSPLEYRELFSILLEHGKQFLFQSPNNLQNTALHTAFRLGCPCINRETLELLFTNCPVNLSKRNRAGYSELYYVISSVLCRKISTDMLTDLIELGVDINDYCISNSKVQFTPLSLAIQENNATVLKFLLEVGANINKPHSSFNKHNTPLALAIKIGNTSIVKIVLSAKADVNQRFIADSKQNTPLAYALSKGDTSVIKLLLESGADVNQRLYTGRFTPLSGVLVRSEHKTLLCKMLLDAGADPNALFLCDKYDKICSPLDFIDEHMNDSENQAEIKEILKSYGGKRSTKMDRMKFKLSLGCEKFAEFFSFSESR